MTHVLGIETSCDETAVAIVRNGEEILSNVIASQSQLHESYGGVYPEMAAREHVKVIVPVIDRALQVAHLEAGEIDWVAVTQGPGLIGSLLVGINAAKSLALGWKIPFIGVNHVEAHLYSAMMSNHSYIFPSIGLVVSGGHTFLVKISALGKYERIGTTVDDALGEAFDKVASLLGLPYPGGPHIEALALKGRKNRFCFKEGIVKGRPWDFSFSGLKTQVLYKVKGQDGKRGGETLLNDQEKADVAVCFQEAALGTIVDKTLRAAKAFDCRAIYVGGGVSQNRRLRNLLSGKIPVYWPKPTLCLDNGAMIAGLGFHIFDGIGDSLSLEPSPKKPL